MKVVGRTTAWKIAGMLFPSDYELDENSTARAGYPIYRSTNEDTLNDTICDLGDRLEVNVGAKSENIWYEEEAPNAVTQLRKFFVYLDGDREAVKCAVPAPDEEAALRYVEGNGEVVAIKEVYCPIDVQKVSKALEAQGFGYQEVMFIARTLTETGIAS